MALPGLLLGGLLPREKLRLSDEELPQRRCFAGLGFGFRV